MVRKRSVQATAGACVALVVIAAVYWRGSRPKLRTLADALAEALQADPANVQVNVPPADGRYPGCVLVRPVANQVAVLRPSDRPADADVTGKPLGDLGLAQSSAASGLLSADLRGAGASAKASSEAGAEVTVELKAVRVFERPLGKALKDALLADGDVVSARKRGLNPEVVFRSYEATPVLTVRQSAAGSAAAWERAKGRLLEAGATTAAGGALRLVATRPVVVAYETVAVEFVAGNFSAGGPDDVRFTPHAAAGPTIVSLDPAAFGLHPSGKPGSYAAAGTSRYRSKSFGDLRSVEPSLELAAVSLESLGAVPLAGVTAPGPSATSRAAMDAYLDQLVAALRAAKPAGFVFYYAGHAVARSGGQLYLVLSDYDGDLKKDLGDEQMLGLPRAQLEAPKSPLGGSNIGDILDVVNAASGEFPDSGPGLYAVAEVHKRLEAAGVPFALVVDSCFESGVMEQLRRELRLTKSGDYYGPAELPATELQLYAKALREFGVAPYLHDANPVVLSSKPGSVALEVPHPAFEWEFAPRTAPLAASMYRLARASVVSGSAISWGQYLRGLADYAGTGEISTTGSISWSDFGPLENVPALVERR